ncbi:hypothetical protein LWI29_007880 [Acer saccharum]|uniref:O-fucosyltransferase family protein n=1 Tax=Acer saccharum TaxID=4024 RepID=A0AA39RG99_ACESA|nr:hypothetical protein LWI29_007880 [Acer saccharum]
MDHDNNVGFQEAESGGKPSKMEVKYPNGAEKLRGLIVSPPLPCVKFCAIVVTAMILSTWFFVGQLATMNQTLTLQNYLSSFSHSHSHSIPPERVYENNGYLIISCNGGLNQMRTGICDMVSVARYLNLTLIVPELDNSSFWNDNSQFSDIFDTDHFITSLRDEVRIVKELPSEQKKKLELESVYSMYPFSWSSLRYYLNRILPRIQRHEVVHFTLTDFRLANNGLPEEIQKLRCRVNFRALKFTAPIEETGRKIVRLLRQRGRFLVLHLRYEKDMLAFTGCTEGCSKEEINELTQMRYSHPHWKHMGINPKKSRRSGLCPLTPEETALVLQALGIDRNIQIYIAAGEIYGDKRRMSRLEAAYPNLVKKETILEASDLKAFENHSNQMAALDFIVAVESDIFLATYGGNMAKVVEGHRRYLGFKTTILPNTRLLVSLIDQYKTGKLNWDEFSLLVKESHEGRMGKPTRRLEIPDSPKDEDYFYSNPQECLPPLPIS